MKLLEIDILIAEKIFGHKVVHKTWNKGKCHSYSIGEPDYYDDLGASELHNPLPNYSSDIKDAWTVIEALQTKGFSFSLLWDAHILCKSFNVSNYANDLPCRGWKGKEEFEIVEDSAPLAICLAALKTVQ